MTRSRRRPPARTVLVPVAALVAVALGLASCGTIPPTPSAAGSTPAVSSTPTSTSPDPSETVTPTSRPSTTASPTAPASPEPTAGRSSTPSTKPAPTPPPDTYVAHFHGKTVWVPKGHGAPVSFTFDDGPWPGSTAQVLALLKTHHVRATFCLIGNQARAYPSLVRREVAAGHTLCDHSRDHNLAMNGKGKAFVYAEVSDGLADIRRVAPKGTRVTFYRQPGGFWSPAVVKAMAKNHLDPLRWDVDPRDWSRPGSAVVVRRVVKGLHPGAVILMHDGGGDRSQSVEALRFLLSALIAAGWKPVVAPHRTYTAKQAATPQ